MFRLEKRKTLGEIENCFQIFEVLFCRGKKLDSFCVVSEEEVVDQRLNLTGRNISENVQTMNFSYRQVCLKTK